ncbi:hypothetical protein FXO38_32754 [Capsicum annuum]|nr:hypothetical protein FXO38_32754 [Capsicum annuum]KAF3674995.1 hypothetical protein FXO37_06108 [Capsicum annuum]
MIGEVNSMSRVSFKILDKRKDALDFHNSNSGRLARGALPSLVLGEPAIELVVPAPEWRSIARDALPTPDRVFSSALFHVQMLEFPIVLRLSNASAITSVYVYTNLSPTVDELKCLQLPNHVGMDLKDYVNSTLPSTACGKQKKVDHKAMMTTGSLRSDNFDDFTIPPPVKIVTKSKARDVKKNETDGDELRTLKEQPKDIPDKNFIDDNIAGISLPVVAIQYVELLQKENLPDPSLPTDNVEVQNQPQESIDSIIADISTPIVAMPINLIELSQKENLPDPSLQTDNMDNIIVGIATPVVAMQIKSVSPKETNDSECHIHDSQFPSGLPEADLAGDTLLSQDDYKRSCLVVSYEDSLVNIIKGFNILAALPWHMVDNVYVPINCDGNFHWVAGCDISKEKMYSGYDSILLSHHRESSYEIQKLSVMLPTYLCDSGFLKNTERTVWSILEEYTDKMSQGIGVVNENPFDVEYVEDIAQQVGGSL